MHEKQLDTKILRSVVLQMHEAFEDLYSLEREREHEQELEDAVRALRIRTGRDDWTTRSSLGPWPMC